jgi:hypothetical protein
LLSGRRLVDGCLQAFHGGGKQKTVQQEAAKNTPTNRCGGSVNLIIVFSIFKLFLKIFRTTIKKLEADVGKDITTLVTRIGDFRADSKIKWVDLCDAFTISDDGKQREYRVTKNINHKYYNFVSH